MKQKCTYPDCDSCPFDDCKVTYPKETARSKRVFREKREAMGLMPMPMIQKNRQDNLYRFIVEFTSKNLYPPTYSDILEAGLRVGGANVRIDLRRLEERGLIIKGRGCREITLVGYKLVKEEETDVI